MQAGNENLKEAKNAEKSHFKIKRCHFWAFLESFKILFSSLHNPTHKLFLTKIFLYFNSSKKGRNRRYVRLAY